MDIPTRLLVDSLAYRQWILSYMEDTNMKLSDASIRNVKRSEKVQKLSDGGGLYLHVSPTGGKLWRMAYRFNGKQ